MAWGFEKVYQALKITTVAKLRSLLPAQRCYNRAFVSIPLLNFQTSCINLSPFEMLYFAHAVQ